MAHAQCVILIASCCYLVKDDHRLWISNHYCKILRIKDWVKFNLFSDRHQVWRSHDPMSVQNFPFDEGHQTPSFQKRCNFLPFTSFCRLHLFLSFKKTQFLFIHIFIWKQLYLIYLCDFWRLGKKFVQNFVMNFFPRRVLSDTFLFLWKCN